MNEHGGKYANILLCFICMIFASTHAIESRSVNLALETSFLFDPKDMKQNATFVNKVQNILNKLKTVLDPNPPVFRNTENVATPSFGNDKTILTKFLSEIGSKLIHFDDDEIKLFAIDFQNAVKKLVEKDDFKEICEDDRLKYFILNSVDIWANMEPLILKLEIAKFLIKVDTNAVIELFRVMNRVFEATDEMKFKKLGKIFAKSVKQGDYKKFLYKTIDYVIFKKYKKLNIFFRHVVRAEINKFTEYVAQNYPDRCLLKKEGSRRLSLANIARAKEMKSEKESGIKNKEKKDKKSPTIEEGTIKYQVTTKEVIDKLNFKNYRKAEAKKEAILIDKDLKLDVRNLDNKGISVKIH